MKRRSSREAEQSGWTPVSARQWQRCPDCELRNALAADGHVMKDARFGFRLSVGCETCEGRGEVAVNGGLDFYSTGKS